MNKQIMNILKFSFCLFILTFFFTTPVNANQMTGNFTVTLTNNIEIYEMPSESSFSLATGDANDSINIISVNGDWTWVSYDKTIGYVKTDSILTTDDMKNFSVAEDSIEIGEALTINSSVETAEETVTVEEEKAEEVRKAELLPWSEAKNVFTTGVAAEIYDIYSGSTYYVKSFSNGNHADVDTVTKDDTAVMFETFGGKWSWDVRPIWVTINGRTMAASINGMPHAKGVTPDNGMNGQVCIHFYGSSTHNGNKSFTKLHQDVLKTAYDLAAK